MWPRSSVIALDVHGVSHHALPLPSLQPNIPQTHCQDLSGVAQHCCALLHSILFGSKCTAIQFCVFKWPTIIPKCICEWCPLSSGCMWCLELWGIWSVCDFHKTLDTHSCKISLAVWNSVLERGFQPTNEDLAQCFLDVSSPSHPVSGISMCVRSSYLCISFCPDVYLLATFSAVLALSVGLSGVFFPKAPRKGPSKELVQYRPPTW